MQWNGRRTHHFVADASDVDDSYRSVTAKMTAEFCYEHVQTACVEIAVVTPKVYEQRTSLDHIPRVATKTIEDFRFSV